MKGSNLTLLLKRHSSTILTVIGVIGVGATAVTAVRATPKALKLLDKAKEEKGEDLTKLETVQTAGPAYIPSVVFGAATVTCVIGANILNKRQQASIASAYALISSSYKEYRAKLKELYGEEADTQVREAIEKEKCTDPGGYVPGQAQLDISGEKITCYDEYRGKYFETTMAALINAEYHFNRNFALYGYASLNDFYSFLGLEATEQGDALGWAAWKFYEDGFEGAWIDIDHRKVTMEDGMECYILEYVIPPNTEYLD